ncbi:MAG TPA: DoxX family protein [Chitinophagaceae bacterium]|nr:DoxX family protein [Chitinophagaceae bacterium]
MLHRVNSFFNKRKDYGIIFLRLVIAWRLIAGVWPFVVRQKPVTGVISFFDSLHLPLPSVGANVSIYAQFICGILYALGWWMRPAAIIMIINFSVAIIAAHMKDAITDSFAAWAIWAASVLFLFTGAGKLSMERHRGG